MASIGVSQAADRLRVSARRIRAMIDQGLLRAEKVGGRWLLDSNALIGIDERRPRGGRPFSQAHALGALFLASKEDAPWLSDYEKWRIRKYALPRLRRVIPRLNARARVRHLRAPSSLVARLMQDQRLIRSGVSAAENFGAPVIARDVLDGYYPEARLAELVHRYALPEVPEASANLILRGVDEALSLGARREMPIAVVAADLLQSSDARVRRAGRRLLGEIR